MDATERDDAPTDGTLCPYCEGRPITDPDIGMCDFCYLGFYEEDAEQEEGRSHVAHD